MFLSWRPPLSSLYWPSVLVPWWTVCIGSDHLPNPLLFLCIVFFFWTSKCPFLLMLSRPVSFGNLTWPRSSCIPTRGRPCKLFTWCVECLGCVLSLLAFCISMCPIRPSWSLFKYNIIFSTCSLYFRFMFIARFYLINEVLILILKFN